MFQLIYASAATVPFSDRDLQELLADARTTNESLGLSGMLLFDDGSFLQVLEGERDAVLSLFEKIQEDSRHTNVRILLQKEIDERSFGDWRMGFFDATGLAASTAGYVDFFSAANPFGDDADRAQTSLLQFREGRWRQQVDG